MSHKHEIDSADDVGPLAPRTGTTQDQPVIRYRTPRLIQVLLVLLMAHTALVYLAPQYLMSLQESQQFVSGVVAQTVSRSRPHPKRVIERDGRQWLWGGYQPDQHFDITHWRLEADQLHYGLGREAFPALIDPQFVSVAAAKNFMQPAARVLLVTVGDETKVYPVDLLIRHEVVNDTVGGVPIFAAYCILADLGAVYDRRIDGHELTFGVSGYTYFDPEVWEGKDAFVLWDRDTQSLWWPPIGLAVSGPMQGQSLPLLEASQWRQTTWADVLAHHADARVLYPGQNLVRPEDWPPLDITTSPASQPTPGNTVTPRSTPAIAPHWGQHSH